MKNLLLTGLIVSAFSTALADLEITREEAGSLQSVDLQKLKERPFDYEGRIVRLKFNYRSQFFKKQDDGSVTGTLSIYQSNIYVTRSAKYGHVEVTVPAEGVPWFMKIPTTTESRSALTVIARIKKGGTNEYPQAEVLGREIKTDAKGPRIIW